MTAVVLSSDVFTASGAGTVGASPVIHSFGARDARFRIKLAIASVVDTGLVSVSSAVQFSEDAGFTAPNFVYNITLLTTMGPQILSFDITNQNWTESSPDGLSEFMRWFWFIFGTGTVTATVTVFDGVEIIVQSGTGVAGATVYLSVSEVLTRMAAWNPGRFPCFPTLAAERQDAVWVEATRVLELEVERCVGGAPLSSDPAVQLLLFPRDGAEDSRGSDIDGLVGLDDYFDGLILFAEEIAAAEKLGRRIAAPAEDAGLVEVEADPQAAGYRERWRPEGKSGSFWTAPGRDEIWRLVSSAFPRRARG